MALPDRVMGKVQLLAEPHVVVNMNHEGSFHASGQKTANPGSAPQRDVSCSHVMQMARLAAR